LGVELRVLTTAHELLNKNYNVILFENNPIVGGFSKNISK